MHFKTDMYLPRFSSKNKNGFDYEIRGVKLKSVHCLKDLGVKISSSLKFSQQCKDDTNRAIRALG